MKEIDSVFVLQENNRYQWRTGTYIFDYRKAKMIFNSMPKAESIEVVHILAPLVATKGDPR